MPGLGARKSRSLGPLVDSMASPEAFELYESVHPLQKEKAPNQSNRNFKKKKGPCPQTQHPPWHSRIGVVGRVLGGGRSSIRKRNRTELDLGSGQSRKNGPK